MVKAKGKGSKGPGANKVLPEGLNNSDAQPNQPKSMKMGLYHHFRIDEMNLEQLNKKFLDVAVKNTDIACRNLTDLLLMSLEMKDYADKAFDDDFWQLKLDEVIDMDTIKNFKATDIVFKKDKQFRDSVLKFFGRSVRVLIMNLDEPGSEGFLTGFLTWVLFLSKVSVREFRKVACEIALEIFDSILKLGAEHIDNLRKSSEKFSDWFASLMNILYTHYFFGFLKNIVKDVDGSIRSMAIDHIFASYKSQLYHTVDEGVVLCIKRNKMNLSKEITEIKQGPLTQLSLHLVFESLKDPENTPEKILRPLQSIPKVIHDMASSCRESTHSEWTTEGTKFVKKNIDIFGKNKNALKKVMDSKEEVGALAIHVLKNISMQPEMSSILNDKDLAHISVMVTSIKKKVRGAAIDFFLTRIGERTKTDDPAEEQSRILHFIELFQEVNTTIAEEITHVDHFDDSIVTFRLEAFQSRLNDVFDVKQVCEMFLSHEKLDTEEKVHVKGYLGCLLHVMHSFHMHVLTDASPKTQEEKDLVETIQGTVVSISTRIKEDLKKSLVAKNLKNPELLKLYVRLLGLVCGENDHDLNELVLSLYDKTLDLQTLRTISKNLRLMYEKLRKESLIKSEQFSEKISRVFYVQLENLSTTIGKVKDELKKQGNNRLRDNRKLMEELKVGLRKATALKECFKPFFQIKDAFLEDGELLMNLYVDQSLVDTEILERIIVLLTTNLTQLLSTLGGESSNQRFIKYRDSVVEHLTNLLSPKSLSQMEEEQATVMRRFTFLHLMGVLRLITADTLEESSIKFDPPKEFLQRIWDFIFHYCFKTGDSPEGQPAGYQPTSGEKRAVSRLDEELPAGSPQKEDEADPIPTGLTLRRSEYNFKEDVQALLAVVFTNSRHLLKSKMIMNFTARFIDNIYQLTSDQEYCVRVVEKELLLPMIQQEKKYAINPATGVGVMIFTKLLMYCFENFDLPVLKGYSKSVLSLLRSNLSNENENDVLTVNYRAVTFGMLNQTIKHSDKPFSVEKLMLFLKKGILGERYCQRLLYNVFEQIKNMKEQAGKEKELEFMESPEYQHMNKIRKQLLQLCDKQVKEDENAARDASASKGRRASRSAAPVGRPSNAIVDEREEARNTESKENPVPAKPGRGRRGAAQKMVAEQEEKPASRSQSPKSKKGSEPGETSPKGGRGRKKIVGVKETDPKKNSPQGQSRKSVQPQKKGNKIKMDSDREDLADKAKKAPPKEVKRGGSKKTKGR